MEILELNNIKIVIKIAVNGFGNTLDTAIERFNKLEDGSIKYLHFTMEIKLGQNSIEKRQKAGKWQKHVTK